MRWRGILLYAVVFGVFMTMAVSYIDPDFGIHVGTGKIIWENKMIPREDNYSFTRSGHAWYYHEWLGSILMYLILDRWGYVALAGAMSLVGTVGVCALANSVTTQGKRNSSFEMLRWIAVVSMAMVVMPYMGVRMQVFTWLFWAIELWALYKLQITNGKWQILVVGLLVLWSNVHGGWVLGLGLLGMVTLSNFQIIKFPNFQIKFGWGYVVVAALSLLGIAIFNPYGLGVLREIFLTVGDANLRGRIAEWMPMYRLDFFFVFYTGLVFAIAFMARERLKLWQLVGVVGLFVAAMMSNRHGPLFALFSLPVLLDGIRVLLAKNVDARRLRIAVTVLAALVGIGVLGNFWFTAKDIRALSEQNFYPKEALTYLVNLPADARVYNYYGWGGYLVWKMPGRKWFIDGRMPSWEGILDDYDAIAAGESKALETLAKYKVEYVLWPKNDVFKNGVGLTSLVKKLLGKVGVEDKKNKGIEVLMEEGGWSLVYEDSVVRLWNKLGN